MFFEHQLNTYSEIKLSNASPACHEGLREKLQFNRRRPSFREACWKLISRASKIHPKFKGTSQCSQTSKPMFWNIAVTRPCQSRQLLLCKGIRAENWATHAPRGDEQAQKHAKSTLRIFQKASNSFLYSWAPKPFFGCFHEPTGRPIWSDRSIFIRSAIFSSVRSDLFNRPVYLR